MSRFTKILFSLFFAGVLAAGGVAQAEERLEVYPVRLFLFHANWCPHCKAELAYLEELKKKFPNLTVVDFEISQNQENNGLMNKVIEVYQVGQSALPTSIIGGDHIIGFDKADGIGKEIEELIKECSFINCSGWLDKEANAVLDKTESEKILIPAELAGNYQLDKKEKKEGEFLLFGKEISLSNHSVTFLGMLLGLADGINPCMFSVLIFLLTYLLAIGSKKRAMKAGVVFVVTTFVVYFLFMLGIIQVVEVLRIVHWLRWLVIGFALVAGLVMLKDFFFYGKWVSLEINDRFKPLIEKLIHRGTVPSAFLLAFFSSLVELPCTAGIPLAYVAVLAERNLNPYGPLLLYNLFFVLPSVVIVLAVAFAWTKIEAIEKARVDFRKWMRLVAGALLLLLALALYFNWL